MKDEFQNLLLDPFGEADKRVNSCDICGYPFSVNKKSRFTMEGVFCDKCQEKKLSEVLK